MEMLIICSKGDHIKWTDLIFIEKHISIVGMIGLGCHYAQLCRIWALLITCVSRKSFTQQ
jgi:hypothetical protein